MVFIIHPLENLTNILISFKTLVQFSFIYFKEFESPYVLYLLIQKLKNYSKPIIRILYKSKACRYEQPILDMARNWLLIKLHNFRPIKLIFR